MKKYRLYIRQFYILSFAILLAVFPVISKAQNNRLNSGSGSLQSENVELGKSYSHKTQFKNNLAELSNLYCWSDTGFYTGEFEINSIQNIQAEFEKLNLTVFAEFQEQTNTFYEFLNDLQVEEKQNLIRYFSFYENEFETVLKSEGLPTELKYLAPALSAMNLKAISSEGKAGIWQLTHFQAVLIGIQISKLVDERFNVSLATIAAARQIKQNLQQFGNIDLAVAAFIFGNVKVRNATVFAENRGREVTEFLPVDFNETVAVFQAMAIFLNTNKFEIAAEPFAKIITLDTVNINHQLHFQQVSKVIGISESELQFLNPQFKFSIIPGNIKSTKLILPNGKLDDFVLGQDSIYNTYDSTLFDLVTQKIEYPPSPNRQYVREPVKDLEIEGKTKIKYRLKTGDVLGIIAENYDVRVADLKYWNNIYNERKIQAGKNLDIFVDDDKADYYLNLSSPQKNKSEIYMVEQIQKSSTHKFYEVLNSTKKIEHVVKSGESPYVIAKKYDGVTPDNILEWNNIDDARKIQIGQKLIVYLR
ncbi:MAG: LysM peptidoglycan-binding domain-containing protein [Draconibacterium sp.]|nr:LysM peptidoglycan-binding domain-containing protein [Draconibacterium sp.]